MFSVALSIVIPVFNEQDSITEIIKKCKLLFSYFSKVEIIIVNDGSTDNTEMICHELKKFTPELKIISLVQNSGHMAALTAGLKESSGDWIATIDGDGQDDPIHIIDMYKACLNQNADICFTQRRSRAKDTFYVRIFSSIFYKVLYILSDQRIVKQSGDFRLISKKVQETLNSLPEINKMYRVLIPSLGYKSVVHVYERDSRITGKSKYGLKSLFKLSFKSFLATTGAPLRLVSIISIFTTFCSVLVCMVAFYIGYKNNEVPGWASLVIFINLIFFLQSISSLVMSEFLLILLSDVRQRPIYQIKRDTQKSLE